MKRSLVYVVVKSCVFSGLSSQGHPEQPGPRQDVHNQTLLGEWSDQHE